MKVKHIFQVTKDPASLQRQQANLNLQPSEILDGDVQELSKFQRWKNDQELKSQKSSEGYSNKMGIGRQSFKSVRSFQSFGGAKENTQMDYGHNINYGPSLMEAIPEENQKNPNYAQTSTGSSFSQDAGYQ